MFFANFIFSLYSELFCFVRFCEFVAWERMENCKVHLGRTVWRQNGCQFQSMTIFICHYSYLFLFAYFRFNFDAPQNVTERFAVWIAHKLLYDISFFSLTVAQSIQVRSFLNQFVCRKSKSLVILCDTPFYYLEIKCVRFVTLKSIVAKFFHQATKTTASKLQNAFKWQMQHEFNYTIYRNWCLYEIILA